MGRLLLTGRRRRPVPGPGIGSLARRRPRAQPVTVGHARRDRATPRWRVVGRHRRARALWVAVRGVGRCRALACPVCLAGRDRRPPGRDRWPRRRTLGGMAWAGRVPGLRSCALVGAASGWHRDRRGARRRWPRRGGVGVVTGQTTADRRRASRGLAVDSAGGVADGTADRVAGRAGLGRCRSVAGRRGSGSLGVGWGSAGRRGRLRRSVRPTVGRAGRSWPRGRGGVRARTAARARRGGARRVGSGSAEARRRARRWPARG